MEHVRYMSAWNFREYDCKRGVCYKRAEGDNLVALMEGVILVDVLSIAANKLIAG